MKKYIILAGVALLAACTQTTETEQNQRGCVKFEISTALAVDTRAQVELPAECVPAAEDMHLVIEGTDTLAYDGRFGDYTPDMVYLLPGEYTATVTYGDPTKEGPEAYAYAGSTTFSITARRTTTANLTATLTNAVVSLDAEDEWFNKYYTDIALTVHTDNNKFTLAAGDVVFVKPGAGLYLSGTARKQTGVKATFDKTQVGTAAAQTWHTIDVTLEDVGSVDLNVTFDDSLSVIPEVVVELNPKLK